jgi:protein disulfide-isomerase A6
MGFSLMRSLFLCSFLAAGTNLFGSSTCGALVQAAAPWFENASDIEVIPTVTDFRELLADPGVWMVYFTDGNKVDKELEVNFSALGTVMKGIFHVAVVDLTTSTGQEISASMPTLAPNSIIILGNDKTNPVLYKGASDYKSLVENLVQVASTVFQERAQSVLGGGGSSKSSNSKSKAGPSRVIQLTSANFEEQVLQNPEVVVVAFTAPWCGHCKRLEPEWEQAAKQLHGQGAVLGWVDATIESKLATAYGVKGYPNIKVFPGGKKTKSDAVDYQGERTASSIVMNTLREVDRTGVPKEVDELTSMTVLKEQCSGANHICVLAALPHIMDSGAAGRNKYRDLLGTVGKSFRGSPVTFLWFEGSTQPALEEAMDLSFGFPALVAFSMDREAYAVLKGSFSEKGIPSFLNGVMTGRQPTTKLSQLPTVVTVTPWDGQDAAPIEDEIPLSEIMGWDDDDEDEKGGEL